MFMTLSATSSAAVVAIFGYNSNAEIASFLQANGHTVVYQDYAAPEASALNGVDAVIALRADGNDAVKSFVLDGGLLITEWTSAEWAINTANLLSGTASNGGIIDDISYAQNSTITLTDKALRLGLGDNGLGSQYADGERTGFAYSIENTTADILATSEGKTVMVGGSAGDGYVLANSLDWADIFQGNTPSGQWLLNALNIQYGASSSVPEPALPALLGLGLTAMFFSRRRAKAAK